MRDGFWSERATWAHRIAGSACSSSGDDETLALNLSPNGSDPLKSGDWPTVVVQDSRSAARHTTTTGVMHPGTMLLDAVRSHPGTEPENWPTITTFDAGTPRSPETFDAKAAEHAARHGNNGIGKALRTEVLRDLEEWPTPRASPNENRTTKVPESHGKGHGSALQPTVLAQDGVTRETPRKERRTLRINADWCEQLMGFPAGWTDVPKRPTKAKTAATPSSKDGPPVRAKRNTRGKPRASSDDVPPTGSSG